MIKKFVIVTLLLPLFGCLTTNYDMTTIFNKDEVSWINDKGSSTITGQAFLNQKGGGVVTCAGREVSLIPLTAYSTERMNAIFKSSTKGYYGNDIYVYPEVVFNPSAPAEYFNSKRTALCNAQGNFKFEDVPANKEYFILTNVTWEVGGAAQGGSLMIKVTTTENETTETILVN